MTVTVSGQLADAPPAWAALPPDARPDPADPDQWSVYTEEEIHVIQTAIDQATEQILSQLAEIAPVHTGLPLPQGDLMVIPAAGKVPAATKPIPAGGVPLVRGNGGHVHLLMGRVLWAPGADDAQTIGTVTVPDGEVGYLAHGDGTPASALNREAEHALVAFGAGTYVVRRQREQADEIHMVAD